MHGRLKKVNLIILIVNIVILGIFAVLYAVISRLRTDYSSDSARQQWNNDTYSYAQISTYLSSQNGLDIMGVYSLQKSVEDKLKENSVTEDEKNPGGRLWISCASSESPAAIKSESGLCNVALTGTWGDYFIFHPEELLCGSYYSDDDVNFDRIILDKQSSWQLFGAINTVGMTVTINENTYYVAGVTDIPEGGHDEAAYGTMPRAYVPYQAMSRISPETRFTAYEVCIPDIVRDFAYNMMCELDPADSSQSKVIDQSGRFELIKLFKGFKKIPENVMITSDLSYPWTENRTRGAEITAQILAGPMVYMLIIPALSLVYLIFLLTKLAGKGLRAAKEKAEEKYQKKISEAYFNKRKTE